MTTNFTEGTLNEIAYDFWTQGYYDGYKACSEIYESSIEKRKKQHSLFVKQKILGIVLLIVTFLIVMLLDGDATVSLILVPISILMIFSEEMKGSNERRK